MKPDSLARELLKIALGIRSPSLAALGEKEPTMLDVIMRRFGYVPLEELHERERQHNVTSDAYSRLKTELDKLRFERKRQESGEALVLAAHKTVLLERTLTEKEYSVGQGVKVYYPDGDTYMAILRERGMRVYFGEPDTPTFWAIYRESGEEAPFTYRRASLIEGDAFDMIKWFVKRDGFWQSTITQGVARGKIEEPGFWDGEIEGPGFWGGLNP